MRKPDKRPETANERLCTFPGCGRPLRAHGLCLTHDKHRRQGKPLREIKPRRKSRPGAVKVYGLSLTPECAALLQQAADARGGTVCAVLTDVLEDWAREKA